MLEWIREAQRTFPNSLGFGRMVGGSYRYWHSTESTGELNGKELLERASETLKVSRMYGVPTERVKLTCSDKVFFIHAPDDSAVCIVLPPVESDESVWEGLGRIRELAPVEGV